MASIKSLAKDTAIYGMSSIVGRFLNYLLVPFYINILTTTADYGIVTNIYAWVALILTLLTYGMETGFFRFANKQNESAEKVYGTSLGSLAITSAFFLLLTILFSTPIASLLKTGDHPEYIRLMGITVAIDAFSCICFAYLRYLKRPMRFAMLKLVSIGVNIGLNLFFLLLLPYLNKCYPHSIIQAIYNPNNLILYIFISALVASSVVLVLLYPYYSKIKWGIDWALLKRILAYSLPIMIVSIAGVINQSGDKILYPYLIKDTELARSQLGIYGASYKLAVIMIMFTQAFRFAFEPFMFAQSESKNTTQGYVKIMTYFTSFGLIVWVAIVLFLNLAKSIIPAQYYPGLCIVPIVLAANLFLGIVFNLSVWYKLKDKTHYGAWFAVGGAVITLTINILLVPHFGYIASAWAAFCCYTFMMIISYYYGQKYYPIPYEIKRIGVYALGAVVIYLLDKYMIACLQGEMIQYGIKSMFVLIYSVAIIQFERKSKYKTAGSTVA